MKKAKQVRGTVSSNQPRIEIVDEERVWVYTPSAPASEIIRVDGKIVHCPHQWARDEKVKGGFLCSGCGACCVKNDRRQVVEYDRNWNWGNPIPLEDFEPRQRRQKEAA